LSLPRLTKGCIEHPTRERLGKRKEMGHIGTRRIIIAAMGGLLLLGLFVGHRVSQSWRTRTGGSIISSEEEVAFSVVVAKAIRGSLEEMISMGGTIVPQARVEVFSIVSGQLQEVKVKEGAQVKKNDLLAVVRENESKSIPIRSPISGIVVEQSCEPGEIALAATVSGAKPLFAIANVESVKVQVGVPESLMTFMKSGMQARIRVEAYPLDHFPLAIFRGTITSISPTLDASTRMATAEVIVDNQDGRLKPGMFAMVGIVKEKLRDVLLVPKESVIAGEESHLVYVVKGNTVEEREVQVGASDGRWVQVLNPTGYQNPSLSGEHTAFRPKGSVQEGDEVVTVGARMVYDGQRVRVMR